MATRTAIQRLTRDYKRMQDSPTPFIDAHPSEKNILIWHYIITGPPSTPYEGGQYHGTLTFPADFPFKPPAIRMITPSGRFQPNTRLCLSISDFHPKSWDPTWGVSTILTGLLSFMTSDELTTGALISSDAEKIRLAKASREWNLSNRKFVEEFPKETAENREPNAAGSAQRKVPLGVFDASSIGSAKDGKRVNAGNTNRNAPSSWTTSRKLMCVFVVVLSYVVFSRVTTSTGTRV
ncbi:ubiquitin-conjugating enzyme/RWD-like protein [Myxozyma melibiosi]|uniref:Ubiquitin-conjugating enzyme/RWD-like protein n=1 Tax=Myxozyma melibiosi TaxID=54550 RepID=A0ABR1FD43_9ASCO